MNNKTISFVLIRLAIAMSMFGHGLVRLPKLAGFSNWMVGNFEKSFLPEALVVPFSYLLPVAEFGIGMLLLLGLFTRAALIAGSLVMIALIFGSSAIEEWSAIPSQLIHAALFSYLLANLEINGFALDRILKRKS